MWAPGCPICRCINDGCLNTVLVVTVGHVLMGTLVNHIQKDEMEMYNAVGTVGPVSIAYDVSADFRFYKHGVYSRCAYGRRIQDLLTRSYTKL